MLQIEPNAVLPRILLADSLLQQEGAAAVERAETLLAQAEARAQRWPHWLDRGAYHRELLRLDPAWTARLRRRIEAVSEPRPNLDNPASGP